MNTLLNDSLIQYALAALGALVVFALLIWCLHWLRIKHKAALRAKGWQLIHALNAYAAWVECQRDLPFSADSLGEMTAPEPLVTVRQIKRDWFPSLHLQVVRLLKSHERLVQYLWQHSMLRLSQGSPWCPASEDPVYQQLRYEQEDLIDEMIASCRRLTGDVDRVWKSTGSDFNYSNVFPLSEGPATRV
ncbi:MAG: hypothetical protein H7255_17340 [Ramlibacter sp.]|nr:hypothetical protein [Ramlibacter sp.]